MDHRASLMSHPACAMHKRATPGPAHTLYPHRREWLRELFPEAFGETTEIVFDATQRRVSAATNLFTI